MGDQGAVRSAQTRVGPMPSAGAFWPIFQSSLRAAPCSVRKLRGDQGRDAPAGGRGQGRAREHQPRRVFPVQASFLLLGSDKATWGSATVWT